MLKSSVVRPLQVISSTVRSMSKDACDLDFLDKYDPQQVSLLYEPLIIVDEQDNIVGQATKKDAHLLANIENFPTLIHRAFSFFLFDSSTSPSRLLLQQRAPEKITYPSLWANTCCSHPLYNEIETNGVDGVKHAVKRRVQYELGCELDLDLIFLTRIFYQARNIPDDGIFGESEVDYIVVAKRKVDVVADFPYNTNEIQEIKLLTLEQCQELVNGSDATPWFARIVREGLLAQWWSALDGQKTMPTDATTDGSQKIIQL